MEPTPVGETVDKNLPALYGTAVAAPDILSAHRVFHIWKAGDSLSDIVYQVQPNQAVWNDLHIFISGCRIERAYWHVVHPKPGHEIVVKFSPKKDFVRTVLTIAVVVAVAVWAPELAAWALNTTVAATPAWAVALSAIALSTAGMLIVNALVPIEYPELGGRDTDISRSLSITGARNRLSPFATIPVMLGKHIIFPPYAAAPYSELVGDDQYVTMLFLLGYRDLEIDTNTIFFGDQPLSSYTDITYELYTGGSQDVSLNPALGGITLYPDIAHETIVGAKITDTGWVQAVTPPDIDRLTWEIVFPQGLTLTNRGGVVVNVEVQTSPNGTTWTPYTVEYFGAGSQTPIRWGNTWTPPYRGQWYIRMRADQPGDNTSDVIWERYFTMLRSYRTVSPVSHPDAALLAIRAKATDQLSGVPNTVNLVAQSILPDYTTPCWTGVSSTNMILWSTNLTNGNWAKGGVTVTAAQTTAPDGTLTGFKLLDTVTNGYQISQGATVPDNTRPHTFSCYLKQGTSTRSSIHVGYYVGGTNIATAVVFDWATHSIISGPGTVTAVAGGWYRVTCTYANNGTGNLQVKGFIRPDYLTAESGLYCYAWGPQMEQGTLVGDYAPTIGTPAINMCRQGLLTAYNQDFLFSAGGWTAVRATLTHDPVAGTLVFAPTANDPNLNGGIAGAGIAFSGADYDIVRCRVRLIAGTMPAWEGNCWWKTSGYGYGTYPAVKLAGWPSVPYLNDGLWHVIEWNMVGNVDWENETAINNIRIDLIQDISTGAVFEFDYIDIIRKQAWIDTPTSNPASIARYILTGTPNARALATTRIDDVAFQHFHAYCKANNFEYNKPLEGDGTVWGTLQQVCAAGRGRPMQIDGLWTVKVDEPQAVSMQVFSPRNSWGFSGEKAYPEEVHGFRVRYIDAANNYQNDEQIVYATGYDENNSTKFEALEFPGVTKWEQVWKMARYYMAVGVLQPERFTFSTDIENLVCLPMDRIEYQDDCILVGLSAARVESITASMCVLDSEVLMAAQTNGYYALKFRLSDGTSKVVPVTTIVGSTATLIFYPAQPSPPAAIGDLAVFGVFGVETTPLIIKSIVPGSDLSATLTCVPYNDNIYTADQGTIPPYDPTITYPPGSKLASIYSVRSDESVLVVDTAGNLQVQVLGTFAFPEARHSSVIATVVQWRRYFPPPNRAAWTALPDLPRDATGFSILGAQEGDDIEIRVALRFTGGSMSPFTYWVDPITGFQYHTVIGKTTPPPDVTNFAVSFSADGTRFYDWDFAGAILPIDIKGYEIRYWDYDLTPNLTPLWDDMTLLKTVGLITESPYEANAPFMGDWVFAIKAFDAGGYVSVNPKYTGVVTLPLPRMGGTVAFRDAWENSWNASATLTSCVVDPSTGYLVPVDTTTWASMVNWSGVAWSQNIATTIIFEDVVWDFGTGTVAVLWAVSPDFDSTGGASVTVQIRTHPTAIGSGSYATLNPTTVYADRYQQIKVTGTNITFEGIRNIIYQGFAP